MDIAQPPQLSREQAQQRTLQLAWITLVSFMLLFVVLVTWTSVSAWQFYRNATDVRESRLIMRGPTEWIAWQPCGRVVFQRATDQQPLRPCDAVRIADTAGYGQVATIQLFDNSTLDLWASTEIALEEAVTTRWNQDRQQVTLRQLSGYVRYDLHADQPFARVIYRVLIGDAQIELAPGGSYSIEVRPTPRQIQVLDPNGVPQTIIGFSADVATRTGQAVVYGATGAPFTVAAGQRLTIDPTGTPSLPIPARWELIRDGEFTLFTEEEYNNTTLVNLPTLPKSTSWQVYGAGSSGTANGYFSLAATCAPPEITFICGQAERRIAAWFYRTGGQTNGFTTGIQQNFGVERTGVDVSEYRRLTFSAWVRVINQSLALTGDQGTECPIMIRILAKRSAPTDEAHERVLCVYSSADPNAQAEVWPGLEYTRLEPFTWHKISFDLRAEAWFPDYRFLQGIQIYANGHDYDARVTEISLIGEQ